MLVIAFGGAPPEYGPPKLPIIKDTPAETMLQGLIQEAKKKENWFNDERQSAEARRQAEMVKPENAENAEKVEWPQEGWHNKLTREITVPLADDSDTKETYRVTFSIDEGQHGLKGGEFQKVLFRHATILVKGADRLLDQTEAFTLTRFLGFKTSHPKVTMHPYMPALVFYELIEGDEEKELRAQ